MTQKRTHLILHFYFLSQCIYYFILGINIWYYVWNNGESECKFSCCSTKGKTILDCKPQEHVWGKSRFLGEQNWCFLYAGVTQTRDILALSLPLSSVSPFSPLWGYPVQTETLWLLAGAGFLRDKVKRAKFSVIPRIFLECYEMCMYFWAWAQSEAGWVTFLYRELLLFLERRACPLSGLWGAHASWQTVGFVLLVWHGLSTSPRERCPRAREGQGLA